MKNVLCALLILCLAALSLTAAEYRGAETVRVLDGDTLGTDLFAGCRTVDIEGFVNGDVYAGCERITVRGEVVQDVLAGCESLEIRGKVGDMVIFFGSDLLVDGEIGGDVLAFGGKVRITERGVIKGNLIVGVGDLLLEGGRVEGYVRGGAGYARLNGAVGQYLEMQAGHVRFGSNYSAPGGSKLTLPKELDPEKSGPLPDNLEIKIEKRRLFFQSLVFYWWLIALLITGLLLAALFKNFSRDYLAFAGKDFGKHLGVGFLALVAVPVGILILLLLVVTIPVGLILLALYLILLYLSLIFTALFAGDYLWKLFQKESPGTSLVWPVVLGVILVVLVPKIPFLGWLVSLAVICFGLGSFITYIWNLRRSNGTPAV